MLKLEKLNQYYGQSHTLWDLDMEIQKERTTCIMGRNGVGKTTLAKSIMGLLPIKSGKIIYDGKDIAELSSDKRAGIAIGYVPQGREIFPQLTVKENLDIGLLGNRNGLKKVPDKIYELFPVLKEMLGRKGGDLSGGQQQQLVQQIGNVIDYLTEEEKLTVIIVEQKLPFARKHGDDFFLLDRGKVVANGEMSQLNDDIVNQYLSV